MDDETSPSARALLPCLLPLDTLKKIRDQNLLILEPVDTLKQLWLQENTKEELDEQLFPWKEYRLNGRPPQSLKEFLDLFLLENGKHDSNRAIWIPESDAFVCIYKGGRAKERLLPGAYREGVLDLALSSKSYDKLSVFSSATEHAMSCLEFIFGLHDSHFQKLELPYTVPGDNGPPFCPLTNRCLEKLLIQNENRFNMFRLMAFTPEQSRVLAGSGANIGLSDCRFPDGGVAFVDEARRHSSLTRLSFYELLPFEDIHFVWCLDHLNLEYLKLSDITFDDEQTSRALSAAEINYLHLECCEFEDEEAEQVLIDNVRAERGPKGLYLLRDDFELAETHGDFMNPLRGNTHIDIGSLHVCHDNFQTLIAALPEHRGLTHLGLTDSTVSLYWWEKLMGAIAEHPSLQTLSFENIVEDREDHEDESLLFERHEPIHALAGMLAKNEQVDRIQVEDPLDEDVWNAVVVPRLEINLYRKRLLAIQKIQNPATRAAVTARALARLENKPSLQFMLLSQNEDIVFSYLAEALTRIDNEGSFI
jgi:hypothetical protein